MTSYESRFFDGCGNFYFLEFEAAFPTLHLYHQTFTEETKPKCIKACI